MNKTTVNQLIQKLHKHLEQRATETYEICQILASVRAQRLYEMLGYDTFDEFCTESQLSISTPMAHIHCRCFELLKELKYKKAESLEILSEMSVHELTKVLRGLDRKVKLSTLKRHALEYYREHSQLNFTFDADKLARVEAILAEYGLDYTEAGTRRGASEALLAALEQAAPSRRQRAA